MPPSKTKKFSKNILKNAIVLYLVFAAALVNLLVFGYQRDWISGAIFVLVAFLTTFFSKNMIVILCLAMVVANIYKYGSDVLVSEGTKEGFTEAEDPSAHNDTNMDPHNDNEMEPLDSVSHLDQKKEKHEKSEKKEKHESSQKITPELKEKLKKTFNEKVNSSNHSKEKKDKITKQYDAMLTMAEQFSNMQPAIEQFKAEMSSLSP